MNAMDTTFSQLGLNEQILKGVDALGFTTPTPVQEQAIPLVLDGRDIIACAQTGTGKTAAFALPLLQRIAGKRAADAMAERAAQDSGTAEDSSAAEPQGSTPTETSEGAKPSRRMRRRKKPQAPQPEYGKGVPGAGPYALIVTPTRELAQQIENVVTEVCAVTGQRSVIVMGGTKLDRQIKRVEQGCDLLVATPGRLLDLMEHHHVQLNEVEVFVLDEADRMLDMGFWPSVRRIVAALPKERQTLLFSATIPASIEGTVATMLHDPARVEIARTGETAATVDEHLCPVTQGQKTELLKALIEHTQPERVLVFCRTKRRVDDVCKILRGSGLRVSEMHADRRQKDRERALEDFREAKIQVLVATDVMSRGIDVSGIDAVVNYDVPMDPEDYVHRIGRTGRAGRSGQAYTFCAPDEITQLREVEYFTKSRIPTWDLEDFAYDTGRIIPNETRAVTRTTRTMFSGSRARGRGPAGGRYGRHY